MDKCFQFGLKKAATGGTAVVPAADWVEEVAEPQSGQPTAQPSAVGSRTSTPQVLGGVSLEQDREIWGFLPCRKTKEDENLLLQLYPLLFLQESIWKKG